MENIMNNPRKNIPNKIGGLKLLTFSDYLTRVKLNIATNKKHSIDLHESNVLEYELENENSIIIRPSGTEPKIKIYYNSNGKTRKEAEEIEKSLIENFNFKQ